MPDILSEELLARHEKANTRSKSPKPAINTKNLPSLPKLDSLPSLPRSNQKSWAEVANKTAAPNRVTELLSFTELDTKTQISAISNTQKLYGVTIESSRSSKGTNTLLIRGPATSVESAKKELRRRLSPRINHKFDISGEARPAVLGNRGATIRQISQDTDTKISVSDATDSSEGDWSMRTATIDIHGSHQAVQDAIEKINAIIVEKAPQARSSRSEVPIRLIPFIQRYAKDKLSNVKSKIGHGVELTGSSNDVIAASKNIDQYISECESSFATRPAQLPASTAEFLSSDVVFEDHGAVFVDGALYGPASSLDSASAALKAIAESTSVLPLDISRAHNKSKEHADIVGAYLREVGALKKIEQEAQVVIKPDGVVYHISGKDKASTANAKKLLIDEVNKCPPGSVLVIPGFKTSLGISAAHVPAAAAEKKLVLPIISKESTILFFKGDADDFAPSQDEITATLNDVASTFASAHETEASVIEKKVNVPGAEQRFLREPLGSAKTEYQSLTKDSSGTPLVHLAFSGDRNVIVSGLKKDVEKFVAAIPNLIEISKDYLQRSNYTEDVNFDSKHIKNLIGRNGSNISKLREEFDVRIDVGENGVITLRGLEAKVRKARAEIEKTETRLNDEVTEKLEVPQKFHSTLIGGKGKFVRRIKEKYDVHVQFPRPEATEDADVIVLTGPSKGVQQTKKEFKDLIEYEETHSQVQEVNVPASTLNRIIGRGGAKISAIKQDTSTQIDVNRDHNEDGTVTIKIVGEKKAISQAAKRINAAVDEILDNVERSILIDPKYHRFIVGHSNETRRSIIEKAGGQNEPYNSRTLQVPHSSSSSSTIKMNGPSKLVDSIEAQIKELIENIEAKERCKDSLTIPSDQFTVLLGPGGSRKRSLEEKHGVSIDLKRGNPCNVTIKGPSDEQVSSAKAAILDVVSLGQASVKVPSSIASELFNRGMLVKDLESKFKVRLTVNKSSVQKDKRPPKAPELGEKLYAIQYEEIPVEQDSSELTWTLAGKTNEACEEAAKEIHSLIGKLSAHDTIGYLWLSKPNHYSQVIGPMGATITKLRSRSGCGIFVPMNARENLSPIEVRGVKAKVEETTKLILEQARVPL